MPLENSMSHLQKCKMLLLSAGDVVNEDDVLLQIETDKVTIDVRYTETKSGKIREFLVSEDDTVTVGQQVCIVDKGNTEGADEGESPSYCLPGLCRCRFNLQS